MNEKTQLEAILKFCLDRDYYFLQPTLTFEDKNKNVVRQCSSITDAYFWVLKNSMGISTPAARRTDPITSHLASAEITNSGKRAAQQKMIADAVERWPGNTANELAELLNCDKDIPHKRLSECEAAGYIQRGDKKRCVITGKLALTWNPKRA